MEDQDRLSLEKELLELLQRRQGIQKDTLEDSRDFANILQSQTKEITEQIIQKNKIRSLSREVVKQAEDLYSITKDELGTTKNINDLAKKRQDLEKTQIQLSSFLNTIKTGNAETDFDINNSIKSQISNAQKLLKEVKDLENTSNKIANNFGVKTFGALSDITKTIPGLSRFSTPFKEAEEAARKQVITNQKLNTLQGINLQTGSGLNKEKIKQLGLEDKLIDKNGDILTGSSAIQKLKKDGNLEALQALQSQGKSMNSLIAGAKSLGPALAKSFGPAYILFELVQAFLKLDKLAGDTAKSMGISYSQATKLNSEFNSIANSSGNIFVTTKGINESFNQINQSLGTNGQLSKELLVTQTELVKQAFYSVEAATTLSKLSLATGKPAKEITTQFLGQAKALNLVNNTAINEKQLLESIAKTSKATLATFAAQPKELTKAVFEAKKLGLELSQIEAIQTSLLSIESSIAAEFEAEVITGKQLNLERARYFALTNNISELSKELANQGITQAEFAGMNVIQQEAVAKAMGMSREIMGGMLLEQAAISKLSQIDGDTAKEKYENAVKLYGVEKANAMLGEKTLIDQMQSASTQDKFLQSVEKLKEVFVSITQITMPFFEGIANMVGWLAESKGFLSLMTGILATMAIRWTLISAKALITAAASIATASASTLGIGIAAIIGGIVAGGIALNKMTQDIKPAGDLSSPASGKTQVSTKEGGLFELSKNDDLVAAPGLINKLNSPTQPLIVNQPTPTPSPQIDYDKMAQALSKVQVQTNIDGVKISSELQKSPMGMAIRKI